MYNINCLIFNGAIFYILQVITAINALAVIVRQHSRMTFKDDIIKKINEDFGESSSEVIKVLNKAIDKTDYLKTDRVIRCIIFLSKGNLGDLKKYIETATNDTRDVVLWAEYKKLTGDTNFKRIRDFNKTFEECTDNVKE